ncbi:DNA alkylation repair protein [Phaeobacter porticola]|uniref:DNA alkylation repair enzyme n=1 Tax=Phaeobacter porticola TaxID=1844006 RepID=A0A1L3I2X0_9RHOB|nr:DNA alkylation repair protein [Phaeobacter porticola]APG46465.1 DNA alkylation repair enzyme [Phaeobacter porticola]
MTSGFSLKDQLFNQKKTRYLAGLFAAADPGFDPARFEADVMAELPDLELKQRISLIADVLSRHLPEDLEAAAPVLKRALPPPLDPNLRDDDFGDFIFAPLGEFVVLRGLDTAPELSLQLLSEITQRFSMEWAIRPFLTRWTDQTLAEMQRWASSDNYHLRRLVSEGTRPRLPWGQAVPLDLAQPLPLLDQLHADSTRYVTRSVANHLNDISKKDPDLVLDQLRLWQQAGRQDPKELVWMTAHALRGLVKAGHAGAMQMLGYDPDAPVTAKLSVADTPVHIGGALQFDCALDGPADAPVLVDYRLHFQRPGGKTSAKVFKLKQTTLKAGRARLSKRHPLKAGASTFTLVTGTHHLEVLVNGVVRASLSFELLDQAD